jgi:hypothetical protein
LAASETDQLTRPSIALPQKRRAFRRNRLRDVVMRNLAYEETRVAPATVNRRSRCEYRQQRCVIVRLTAAVWSSPSFAVVRPSAVLSGTAPGRPCWPATASVPSRAGSQVVSWRARKKAQKWPRAA